MRWSCSLRASRSLKRQWTQGPYARFGGSATRLVLAASFFSLQPGAAWSPSDEHRNNRYSTEGVSIAAGFLVAVRAHTYFEVTGGSDGDKVHAPCSLVASFEQVKAAPRIAMRLVHGAPDLTSRCPPSHRGFTTSNRGAGNSTTEREPTALRHNKRH